MPRGSRRAAARVKSGAGRSSLAVAVACLSVSERAAEPRASPGRAQGEPGARRALGAAEQSRAGSRAGLGAAPNPAPGARGGPHPAGLPTQHATRQHRPPAIVAAAS
jgi:hypothetical protein